MDMCFDEPAQETLMGPLRREYTPAPRYPEPAPADYSDEITPEHLQALEKCVREEIESEKWELVDGPGW